MRNINEAFEDKEFKKLSEIKEKYGYKSWRKFFIDAANALDMKEQSR